MWSTTAHPAVCFEGVQSSLALYYYFQQFCSVWKLETYQHTIRRAGMKPERYSGNSPAKTIVRRESYDWLLRRFGENRFLSGYHIVIASRDCGDIDFLITVGVDPKHIIACDLDPVARNLAEGYDVIISPYPSIEETVPWAVRTYGARNIASINVDLCSPLRSRGRANGVATLKEVLDETPLAATVFYTFYRSRDGIYDRPRSLRKRLIYLRKIIGKGEIIQQAYPYQSKTYNRPIGSPFCTLILTSSSTPKRKREEVMPKTTKSTKVGSVEKKGVKVVAVKKGSSPASKAWATRRGNAAKKSKKK
jgi:hypothetical protein